VNNLPKVVTQRCVEQDLNPRPTDRKPKCLTRCNTAPPNIYCDYWTKNKPDVNRFKFSIGNGVGCINEVIALRRAPGEGDRLLTGKPPSYVTSLPGQLSLLPAAGQEMSTDYGAVTLCGWGAKAGIAHSICGCTCGWQVKLHG